MKIIISRKGFDAANGGTASPILPDKTMLSMPIPTDYSGVRYSDLYYGGRSYAEIWRELTGGKKQYSQYCHLDPDIRPENRQSLPTGWRPVFGQCGAAETHLEHEGVGVGDLFLFFGWFRETEEKDGRLQYKRGAKNIHAIYGYLQVGEIIRGSAVKQFPWHPHAAFDNFNNTMYVASDRLIMDGNDTGLKGAGTLQYSEDVVLTMSGMPKSRWKLPDFFRDVTISYHTKESFKPEGYFQSAAIGQEFVVLESDEVTDWARKIILKNATDTDRRSCRKMRDSVTHF